MVRKLAARLGFLPGEDLGPEQSQEPEQRAARHRWDIGSNYVCIYEARSVSMRASPRMQLQTAIIFECILYTPISFRLQATRGHLEQTIGTVDVDQLFRDTARTPNLLAYVTV